MDARNLLALVDQLDDNIDDLEEQLAPLLSAAFSATTKKLPVLDRAKLYVLVTYTIESLLFSYIRLHGQNAKEHPVFKELTRVRQYFEKIKQAENGGGEARRENLSLDKEAAGRIIRHGLAGNESYDRQRAEQEAKQKVVAQSKLDQLKNGQPAATSVPQKRSIESTDVSEDASDVPDEVQDQMDKDSVAPMPQAPRLGKKHKKKHQRGSEGRNERRAAEAAKKQQRDIG